VTDITSLIYDQNDKGELSVKKDYSAGFTAVRVNAQWRDEKGAAKEHEITVDMGADMPDRNVFKRIEKLTHKVMLITWLESETSFRYATIVTAGENHVYTRKYIMEGLGFMGVKVDYELNAKSQGVAVKLSTDESLVHVAVIPTDEEYMIASDTLDILNNQN
jgi:hypothetical protein